MPMQPCSLLVVEELGYDFDVSLPWWAPMRGRSHRKVLHAVDDVSFTLERGETFALVGESGCGKSTLARLVAGLYRPTRGRIVFCGNDCWTRPGRGGHLQMIFQDPGASMNPRWRVRDVVAEPLRVRCTYSNADALQAAVAELLVQVGLAPEDGSRYPHEFSGGQRQRISIARAIASHPELLICDEPTSALDVSVQAQIVNLLIDLQRRFGFAYLFISHNLAVVAHIADRVGVMYLGRMIELSEADELFARPRHPYTRMLLDAIPSIDVPPRPRGLIPGEVPDPIAPPPGCTFHPRCPDADRRCRLERPKLLSISSAGVTACHAVADGRLGPF